MKKLAKEIALLSILILPILYAVMFWSEVPDKVPVHWNIYGEVDQYGDKGSLGIFLLAIPLLTYLIFMIVPYIDPKKKLHLMGEKYNSLKWIMTISMALISFLIMYASVNSIEETGKYILVGVGIMIMLLGNYFRTIRPNYFIGIRTPWTLDNDKVWKKTHEISGKVWFIGGILLVVSFFISNESIRVAINMIVLSVIIIVPIAYSFFSYKREVKVNH